MSWRFTTNVEILDEADSRRFAEKVKSPRPLDKEQSRRLREAEERLARCKFIRVKNGQ